MKSKLTFLIILSIFFSYSQKKEYYLNDDFQYISRIDFEKKSENISDYSFRFETDTCFFNIKVLRYKESNIDIKLLDSIKSTLKTISNQEIKDDDVLLINYYFGNDPCSSDGYKNNFSRKYKQFHKKIEKYKNVKQLFIYNSNEGIEKFDSKINWLPDEHNLIESIFFPIKCPCGGFVIIEPNGNYYIEKGEYCYSELFIEKLKSILENQ